MGASQSATEMLRADPRESFEVAASRTNTPIPADKHFHQAKLYAPVTKRKLDHDHNESVKKMRTEGVGLGIGFESGRLIARSWNHCITGREFNISMRSTSSTSLILWQARLSSFANFNTTVSYFGKMLMCSSTRSASQFT